MVALVSEVRKRKRKKLQFFLKAIAVSILIIIAFFKIHDIIIANLVETVSVEEGTLTESINTEAIVIRDEELLTAPVRGAFYPTIAEGVRVREGQTVGRVLTGEKLGGRYHSINAKEAGLLSYKFDNLEGILNINNLTDLNFEKLNETIEKHHIMSVKEKSAVYPGNPLAKIVNDLHPLFLLFKVDKKNFQKILTNAENIFKIQLNDTQSYSGKLYETYAETNLVIIQVDKWDRHLIDRRVYDFEIIIDTYSGIVVPLSALYRKGTKYGVFTYEGDRPIWTPVNVIARVKNKSVVSGIDPGSLVVSNPEIVVKN